MYALVNDVARYQAFVPWCTRSEVLEASSNSLSGRLEVGRAGVTVAITTQNRMAPGERIEMSLADGPFRHFSGVWAFQPIRAPGVAGAAGPVRGCRVELNVEFEFKNRALDLLAGPLFESTWNSLVDTFVHRAREVYGDAR
jgi:ribosome-associated toxin RatA of RatAB toxin-antitoxin module